MDNSDTSFPAPPEFVFLSLSLSLSCPSPLALALTLILPSYSSPSQLKTYVGGLSWNIDDQGLLDAFSPYGQCEAKVMVDKYTGRSRGFGFVTFQTPEECAAAIEGMNGKELDGRAITCNNARQKTYDTEGGGGDGAAGGDGGGHMGGGEHMGHEQGDMQ